MYPKRNPTHLAHAIPHRQSLVCIAATSGAPTLSEKLAWCAGLFDGDGSIGISRQHLPGRKNPTYRLVLSLVQNCDVTIRKFRDYLAVPHCLWRSNARRDTTDRSMTSAMTAATPWRCWRSFIRTWSGSASKPRLPTTSGTSAQWACCPGAAD